MAVVQNPIIGKSKQSVANVVFSSWKGINTLRSKPLSVANPRSPGQVLQREKLAYLVKAFRQIKNVVDVGFVERAVRQSSYNAFIQENIKLLPNVQPFTPAQGFFASKGSLRPVPALQIDELTSTYVDLIWQNSLLPGDNRNDILCAVLWNTDDDTYTQYETTATRETGAVRITFYGTQQTQGLVFAFFVSPDRRKASDSVRVDMM